MNPAASPDRTTPLVAHLIAAGWTAASADVLCLRGAPVGPAPTIPGLTILPARASLRHARQFAEDSAAARWDEPQCAEAAMLHLDDPHWDSLLALADGRAVAEVGVLAVGDVGRIDAVHVAEAFRGRGVGRAMMLRALEICARSLFRHVLLAVDPANAPAQALYRGLGFRRVGEIVNYRAAWTRRG